MFSFLTIDPSYSLFNSLPPFRPVAWSLTAPGPRKQNITLRKNAFYIYRIYCIYTKCIMVIYQSINTFNIYFYRGVVECLKLSPNLRKQTQEVETATFTGNKTKVLNLERKILSNILEMTRKSESDTNKTCDKIK